MNTTYFMVASRSAISALLSIPVILTDSAKAQNQVWIEQIGTSGSDSALASAPVGIGGVYLAGYTTSDIAGPNSGGSDAWLARFDGSGQVLWIRQLGTKGDDRARAATVDGSGGVYIAGETTGSLGGNSAGNDDGWLAHYDGAGDLEWIVQIGTPSHDQATGLAADAAGGAFVCGTTQGSLGGPNAGGTDAWLARYDIDGTQQWIKQLGTSEAETTYACGSNSGGGVIVGGSTQGDLAASNVGGADAWIANYDQNGNQIWTIQLGTPGDDNTYAAEQAGSSGVYFCGSTEGNLGGANAGSVDSWLARYDAWGNRTWITQLGSSGSDYPIGLAHDCSGGAYVSGATSGNLFGPNAGSYDAWLARYDGVGNLLWTQQLGTDGLDEIATSSTDGSCGAFVAGNTEGTLAGTSAGLADLWIARYDTCSTSIYCVGAINSTGHAASIDSQGSTSISQNDFVLAVNSCPPNQVGIFISGFYRTQVSFGDGWLCLTGGVSRLLPSVPLGAQGAGAFQLDFTDASSPASMIHPGEARKFQFWYRDPQAIGSGFNLSDGLSAYFCP